MISNDSRMEEENNNTHRGQSSKDRDRDDNLLHTLMTALQKRGFPSSPAPDHMVSRPSTMLDRPFLCHASQTTLLRLHLLLSHSLGIGCFKLHPGLLVFQATPRFLDIIKKSFVSQKWSDILPLEPIYRLVDRSSGKSSEPISHPRSPEQAESGPVH